MSTLTDAKLRQLPKPIVDKLQSLIRRARRLMLIRGLFATLAVALVCILVIMGIDAAVTLFSDTLRWALSLTGLAITGVAAWYFLVRPLSRRLGLTRIARVIETRHPELQERISTAVELMASDDPDSIRGSAELIEEVVNSAVIDVADVSPETEFKPARSRRPMFVVASIAVFLLLLLAIFPRHVGVLFARAVAPFLDIGNAYANTLVVNPGDLRVAIGAPVTVNISIQNEKIRRAELRLSTTTTSGEENARPSRSAETVERMTLLNTTEDGTQTYQLRFPSVEESFDYRIRAGAAVSEYFTITAVPSPEIEELKIGYNFPDYTRLKSTEAVSDNGDIRAVAHTRVSVTASINKTISGAKLLVGDSAESIAEAQIDGDQARWKFDLAPDTEANWQIELEDADGFANTPLGYQMVALADATPQVEVVAPESQRLKLKPDEFLPIYYTVREDFGFSEVHLFVKPDRTDREWRQVQASPEPAAMKRGDSRFAEIWDNLQKFFAPSERSGSDGLWRGDAPLDLSALDLEGVGKLTVRVIVEDNLPTEFGGPNVGYSDAIVIELDKNARSLVQQTIDNQLKEIQEAIRESRAEVEKANQKAREAERELAREDQVNPKAQQSLEELREHAENAADKLRETAERMKQTAFNQQAEQLQQVADEEVAAAQESADMIPLKDEKKERVAEAKNAGKQLEQASKDLRDIEKSLAEARQDAQLIAELNELANEQGQLAQSAQQQAQSEAQQQQQTQEQQLTREQQQQLAEWQREQQQVQRELGEVLKDNEAALREVLEQRQEQAAELSEQARQLAEQQKSLRDLTAMAAKADEQKSLREKLVANLQQEQQAIAKATREIKEQTEKQAQAQNAAGDPAQSEKQAQNAPAEQAASSPPSPSDDEGQNPSDQSAAGQQTPQMAEADDPSQDPGDPQTPTAKEANDEPASSPTQPKAQQQKQQQAALSEASRQTEQAAQQLNQEDLAAATESAQQARQQLAQAQAQAQAQQAQAEAEAEPSSNTTGESPAPAQPNTPDQAATPSDPTAQQAAAKAAADAAAAAGQLAQLGERQQQVAQQLEAIAGGQIDQALAEQEAQLAAEAADLTQQSSALENATQMAQANARNTAKQATAQLASGKRSADKANSELTQAQQAQNQAAQQPGQPAGQPAPQAQKALAQSQASQQDARNKFEQAARALEQAAKSLAQESRRLSEEEMESPFLDSEDLSQSFQDVSDAATSPTSEEAAQRAQQAAESLQQMAQSAMQQLGQMGSSPPQPGQPKQPGQPPADMADDTNPQLGEGERRPDLDGSGVPPELQALGISIEDWAQMKGTLQSGRDTTGGGSTPAEYRDLVNRYFRVIANEAGANP